MFSGRDRSLGSQWRFPLWIFGANPRQVRAEPAPSPARWPEPISVGSWAMARSRTVM
jgi:hypothetical protein